MQEARVAPALVGKRLAQVPEQSGFDRRHVGSPLAKLSLTARVRYLGRQFEDDENLLVLGAAVVTDLGASYDLNRHCQLYLSAENLTDERVETGRTPDGLVNTGTPRLVVGGVRVKLVGPVFLTGPGQSQTGPTG